MLNGLKLAVSLYDIQWWKNMSLVLLTSHLFYWPESLKVHLKDLFD